MFLTNIQPKYLKCHLFKKVSMYMKNEKENDKNKKVKTPNNKQKKKENTEGKNPMKNSRDNT